MKLKLAFAMLLGAALGIGANEMLHAQAKPPAYLISDITITNEAAYKEWADRIVPTFAQFGAKFLVRGGQTIAIGAWNESDAVKPARSLPDRGAKIRSWVVEGAQ